MKKEIKIERIFCDVCEKDAGYNTCLGCGKEFCYDCKKTDAIEYKHSVFFQGSGDGLYCPKCDKKMRENGDKLHAAYRQIKKLKNEYIGFYDDFNKRNEKAEAELKKLQEAV